jgi:hypothetical protein
MELGNGELMEALGRISAGNRTELRPQLTGLYGGGNRDIHNICNKLDYGTFIADIELETRII